MRLKDERERLEKERLEREKLLMPNEPDENETMMAMMGFGNFDTTQGGVHNFSKISFHFFFSRTVIDSPDLIFVLMMIQKSDRGYLSPFSRKKLKTNFR